MKKIIIITIITILLFLLQNIFYTDNVLSIPIVPTNKNKNNFPFELTYMSFNSENIPYIIDTYNYDNFGYIWTIKDGNWLKINFKDKLKKGILNQIIKNHSAKYYKHALGAITHDNNDNIYAIVPIELRKRHPRDYILVFINKKSNKINTSVIKGKAFLETFTGIRKSDTPPIVAYTVKRKTHKARWTNYNYLYIYT